MQAAYTITDPEALERLYGQPGAASVKKETGYIHPHYRALIEASPFVTLATAGPNGLDVSPRGDPRGVVHVEDENTLLLPDRAGNNRIDSLRNIVADPRVALLFLIPGVGETLRVNGRAAISVDPALLERFQMEGKSPRSVLRIQVDQVFFQCARAVLRSRLWDPSQHVQRGALPSAGTILWDLSNGEVGGRQYDQALPQRQKATLY